MQKGMKKCTLAIRKYMEKLNNPEKDQDILVQLYLLFILLLFNITYLPNKI